MDLSQISTFSKLFSFTVTHFILPQRKRKRKKWQGSLKGNRKAYNIRLPQNKTEYIILLEIRDLQNLAKLGLGAQLI